jgi:hypothetical protein
MMTSWWLLWLVFMFFFFASPVTYGWGYRRWGPPYPSYLQRRRHLQATARGASGEADHYRWGWAGDFVWIILVVGVIWMVTALWWPYGYR